MPGAPGSGSRWTARAAGWTTSSSSASGALSNTSVSTCTTSKTGPRLARPSLRGSDTTTRNDLTRPTPMTERRWRSTLAEGQHNKPHGVHLNTAARLSKGWGPPLLYSDEFSAYSDFGWASRHESVNHKKGECVRNDAHTNGTESLNALAKGTYRGTYHHVSPKHSHRYLNEFAGRYNIRHLDGADDAETANAPGPSGDGGPPDSLHSSSVEGGRILPKSQQGDKPRCFLLISTTATGAIPRFPARLFPGCRDALWVHEDLLAGYPVFLRIGGRTESVDESEKSSRMVSKVTTRCSVPLVSLHLRNPQLSSCLLVNQTE